MACIDVTLPPVSSSPRPTVLVVAAALINAEGRVLLAQRPEGKSMAGFWEFPGGKVDKDEVPELALSRELQEELGITVAPGCFWPLTFASHAYETFHLLMPVYGCRVWTGEPSSREGQKLAWVPKLRFKDYAMPPADIDLVQTLWALL